MRMSNYNQIIITGSEVIYAMDSLEHALGYVWNMHNWINVELKNCKYNTLWTFPYLASIMCSKIRIASWRFGVSKNML